MKKEIHGNIKYFCDFHTVAGFLEIHISRKEWPTLEMIIIRKGRAHYSHLT